MAPPPT
ncbi:peptidyl-prolyl cis-trans isomerase C, partial [Vibrio cholerae CP1037(10)]